MRAALSRARERRRILVYCEATSSDHDRCKRNTRSERRSVDRAAVYQPCAKGQVHDSISSSIPISHELLMNPICDLLAPSLPHSTPQRPMRGEWSWSFMTTRGIRLPSLFSSVPFSSSFEAANPSGSRSLMNMTTSGKPSRSASGACSSNEIGMFAWAASLSPSNSWRSGCRGPISSSGNLNIPPCRTIPRVCERSSGASRVVWKSRVVV
ncbi:hypothetical protein C8Q72DRAFT_57032 [Fomitopsis betulina]|nr:hypothetical protein C8Q72DRAFT_57032 [Fomitopsis betulina]